jgi:predicted aminopeptidase
VREDTPDPLKAQLRLAGELLSFAERELELPARGQYRHYADLGRPHVVWNVFAAPEFSLEAKTWWYPVVGRLDYRGYFREALAEDYARRLARQGYDVHVGGVQAYSTLGWFRDPLLNTFVSLPEAELADLLFHELAHQRLFIPGDTECNEAFAVTVAREGVRRWLRGCGREVQLRDYEEERRREDAVTALMDAARERLEALYAGAANTDPAFLRQAKAAILEELRVEYAARRRAWPGDAGHEDWAMGPINNARLNAVAVYSHWVPLMERLLAGVGGSLPEFYRLMERLRDCRKEERREILRWFEVRTGQVSDWKSLNRGSTRR